MKRNFTNALKKQLKQRIKGDLSVHIVLSWHHLREISYFHLPYAGFSTKKSSMLI